MWKLNDISNAELEKYSKTMLDKVQNRMNNLPKYPFAYAGGNSLTLNTRLQSYIYNLKEDDLKKLFTSKPVELEQVNEDLMIKFFPDYKTKFPRYIELKQKGKKKTKLEEQEYNVLRDNYEGVLRDLEWLLGYDRLISADKEFSYWLCKLKGADTCTYCNRQYIFTVEGKAGNHIVRPQLDHWRPKSLFPLMSLSFYNLIPSCSNCNSSSKGASVFSLSTHIHPYTQTSQNPDFSFHALPDYGGGWKLELWSDGDKKVDNMIDSFHLRELYAMHNSLEVNDIMSLITHNSETYLKTLLQNVLDDFVAISREDAIRMLLGFESNEEKLDKRPFSKMKRDLLKNANVIDE